MMESGRAVLAQRGHHRTPAAIALSVGVHVAIITGAVVLAQSVSSAPRPISPLRLVFLQPPPVLKLDLPPVALHLSPTITTRPERTPKTPKERLEVPASEIRRSVEPPRTLDQARGKPEPPPRLEPAKTVAVGRFESIVANRRLPSPTTPVRSAGFEALEARTPELKIAATAVGAFDRPAAKADPQPGTDRPQAVKPAGFGESASRSPTAPPRAVSDAGFGNSSAPARSRPPEPKANAVVVSGFDARPVAEPPRPQAPKSERVDVPVEVVFKPAPIYTEEARALKIEGEVVLEIEFAAVNEVRVLRVVRGLGHGLDEAATQAARHIRFKPAQSAGRPIDFRTMVHIVFRLT